MRNDFGILRKTLGGLEMSTLTPGALYSYSDNGTTGNVAGPKMVGNGGWGEFDFLFGGASIYGFRIYAVNSEGQLLSYHDNGTPGNVAHPLVVGADGWGPGNFRHLFCGSNLLGENRIYAVNQGGQLLSYSDNGTSGNVGHPVVVGADGWDQFSTVFWCGNIFAVGQNGDLLSYMDGGGPGNVGNPSIAGKSMWRDFAILFGGFNEFGAPHIYGEDNGNLIAYPVLAPDAVNDVGVVVGQGGWEVFKFLFACPNSSGVPRIYGVPK
jgi:hypothetical protein